MKFIYLIDNIFLNCKYEFIQLVFNMDIHIGRHLIEIKIEIK